jgi:WD40 repeat protein
MVMESSLHTKASMLHSPCMVFSLLIVERRSPQFEPLIMEKLWPQCPTVTDINPYCCCFSPNGTLLAVAAGKTVYIWDVLSSDPRLIKTCIGHSDQIQSLTFSSSLISASGDKSVKFWQTDVLRTDLVASDPESTPPSSASIESVSLQAESGIAISSDSDGVVRTWDISTGFCQASFQTPAKSGSLRDAQMINGRLVVVWLGNGPMHIWDTKRGELLQVVEVDLDGTRDLRISGDGSKVFLLAKKFIQAWSMWTGEAMAKVELVYGTYLGILCMGGSRVCLHSRNSLTQEWDFGVSGSRPVPLLNLSLKRPHLDFIGGAAWWYKGPMWIKDTATGKEVFQLSGRYARPDEVQWDGRYLIAGYGSGEVLILDFGQILPQ